MLRTFIRATLGPVGEYPGTRPRTGRDADAVHSTTTQERHHERADAKEPAHVTRGPSILTLLALGLCATSFMAPTASAGSAASVTSAGRCRRGRARPHDRHGARRLRPPRGDAERPEADVRLVKERQEAAWLQAADGDRTATVPISSYTLSTEVMQRLPGDAGLQSTSVSPRGGWGTRMPPECDVRLAGQTPSGIHPNRPGAGTRRKNPQLVPPDQGPRLPRDGREERPAPRRPAGRVRRRLVLPLRLRPRGPR